MKRKKGPKAKQNARARRRNRIFWNRYCVQAYPKMLGTALVLQNNDFSKAQDLVQTVIARILDFVPDKKEVKDPLSYLKRAIRNAWHDAHRKTAAEVSLDELAESDPNNPALRVAPDILEKLAKPEYLFPAKPRGDDKLVRTMQLRNMGYTYSEAAAILREPVSRTRSRVYTHAQKVRDRLRKQRKGRK